jgi:type IV secretion system protein VirD4
MSKHWMRHPDLPVSFQVGWYLLLVIVAASGVLWLAGQLAGLIFEQTWPPVGITEMPGVLARLLADPGDPARAWPPRVRPLLPGPAGFYPALTLALALAVAAAAAAHLGLVRLEARTRGRRPVSARWARRRDLRCLLVASTDQTGRLGLGVLYRTRRRLAVEEHHSIFVDGPTQSFKTSGFVIPRILEWAGACVVTSVKPDVARATYGWRATQGRVLLYDPLALTGLPGATWNPLAAARTWQGAFDTADALVAAAGMEPGSGSETNQKFWDTSAASLLGPLLYAAGWHSLDLGRLIGWIQDPDTSHEEVLNLLTGVPDPDALRAYLGIQALKDPELRSNIYATAQMLFKVYRHPAVRASAATCQITPDAVLDGTNTLFLYSPRAYQRSLRPLFQAIISQIVRAAEDRAAAQPTGRLAVPLLLLLDEAGNVAPLPDLDELATTAAAAGIQIVSIWHSLAQVAERYGRRANTVISSHMAKVFLSGTSDPESLEYAKHFFGDAEHDRVTTTRDHHDATTSSSEAVDYRPLATAAELRELQRGHGVLLYGNLRPIRLKVQPWFTDKRLTQRVHAHQVPLAATSRQLDPALMVAALLEQIDAAGG